MQKEKNIQLTSSRKFVIRDINALFAPISRIKTLRDDEGRGTNVAPGQKPSGMTANFNHSPLIRTSSTFPLDGEGVPSTWRERAECVSTGVRGKRAFTLIELLVVVLIIGILAAIALPQYQKAVEKSRAVEAQLILKEIYQGAQLYFLTHGAYPSSFAELDSAPAWTGREKYYEYSGNVADVRSNGDWSLNLFNDGNMSIARLAGPYKGAGFYINLTATNYPKHKMMCFEATAVSAMIQVRFTRDAGDYCNKIIHADRLPGTDAHAFYQLH